MVGGEGGLGRTEQSEGAAFREIDGGIGGFGGEMGEAIGRREATDQPTYLDCAAAW